MNSPTLHVLHVHAEKSSNFRKSDLVLDSGAIDHMINSEGPMHNIRRIPLPSIVMGNGAIVYASINGDLPVYSSIADGRMPSIKKLVMLKNVLFVLRLKKNLVSVSRLADSGYEARFGKSGGCSVVKDGIFIFQGRKINPIYYQVLFLPVARDNLLFSIN